jgi:predicted nucleic acid-binding protein
MSVVFWDTNLFIYLFEGTGKEAKQVATIRTRMRQRGDLLYTSTLSLGEVLVKPFEEGDTQLLREYERALKNQCQLVTFDSAAARRYAEIRQDRTIRPPDAIQLACAAQAGADVFITNDDRLSQKRISGIRFVLSLDKAALLFE